jgi:C4-dicarboxylate-specific signal transduction histidine kinase
MYDKEFFLNSLTKIEEFVNHLSTTIDDFSNFFKPSKIKKDFYLYEAVDKALSIATYSLSKKSIDLVLDIDKTLKVKTYQNELVQVLLNLIKNAENILIKREIENPKIIIKVHKKDNEMIIQIQDNGKGIDSKIMKKIFEPYFSTKATKKSTGLGLYMSKFIVEDSLGGKLEARNSKDGAVFSIVLV